MFQAQAVETEDKPALYRELAQQIEGLLQGDAAAKSELVAPLSRGKEIFGVIDLDATIPARFDLEDQRGVEAIAAIYAKASAALS